VKASKIMLDKSPNITYRQLVTDRESLAVNFTLPLDLPAS
jgi:hypothetical protein